MIFRLEKLSAILMKARISKGFSQTYMAHKLGISQKAYSYVETGHSKVDLIKFLRIANYTGTNPMFIIEKITKGIPLWECIEPKETALIKENANLEAQISYLKSQNLFLRETVNKLLEKTTTEKVKSYL